MDGRSISWRVRNLNWMRSGLPIQYGAIGDDRQIAHRLLRYWWTSGWPRECYQLRAIGNSQCSQGQVHWNAR